MDEKQVLEEQLEEMLEEGAVDPEDALEIALVAGIAVRMGIDAELRAEVEAWREGPGRGLLVEAYSLLDEESILGDFDEVANGEAEDEEVQDALYDIDELVAGAIWCGQGKKMGRIARAVTDTVRMMPEVFAHLHDDAAELVKHPMVGQEYGLYGYWFAIVESVQ